MFIARHVYLRILNSYRNKHKEVQKRSRGRLVALMASFAISSLLHEGALFVVTRRWMYATFFVFQMGQLPVIFLFNTPMFKGKHAFKNWVFWMGMIIGQPLLCVLYTRHAFVYSDVKQL